MKEGAEPASLDAALGGARDILAEEICLDPALRARLRDLFEHEGALRRGRAPREEERGRAPRRAGRRPRARPRACRRSRCWRSGAASASACSRPASSRPRQARVAVVHGRACPDDHPHAGFLRAAAEDGYRRILKPLLQREAREAIKERADQQALRRLRADAAQPAAGPRRRPQEDARHPARRHGRPPLVRGRRAGPARGQRPAPPRADRGPRGASSPSCRACSRPTRSRPSRSAAAGGRPRRSRSWTRRSPTARCPCVVVPDGGTRALEALGRLSIRRRPGREPREQRGRALARAALPGPARRVRALDPKALGARAPPARRPPGRAQAPARRDGHVAASATSASTPRARDATSSRACPASTAPRPRPSSRGAQRGRPARRPRRRSPPSRASAPRRPSRPWGSCASRARADPRDRTQLHPEQYGLVEEMAAQVGLDVQLFAADPRRLRRSRSTSWEPRPRPRA